MAEDDETENPETEDAESGEEGAEGEGEGGEGGGSKKKLILIIAGALVLLLGGGGAGLYFTGMLDGLLGKGEPEMVPQLDEHGEPVLDEHGEPVMIEKASEEHAEGGGGHGGGHGEGAGEGNFVEVPTMLVNLNTDDGTPRYLRLTVQLELKSDADRGAVEAILPRVIDQFQTYLRELRVKDLRGSAGIYRLQMELLWRVNQAAAPVEVKDVLFQEILIQ